MVDMRSVQPLRVWPALVTSAALAAAMSCPALAQSNPFLRQVDGILLDAPPTADFTIFPEDVLRSRTQSFSSALEQFQDRRFSAAPINRPNLPTPYNSTLGSQAGYYQVTLSEPSLQFIRP